MILACSSRTFAGYLTEIFRLFFESKMFTRKRLFKINRDCFKNLDETYLTMEAQCTGRLEESRVRKSLIIVNQEQFCPPEKALATFEGDTQLGNYLT